MAPDEVPPALVAAVQAYPQTPGQAIEQLRPLADGGNVRAAAFLAYYMQQQGNAEEGIPYARRAIEAGFGQIAQIYANDLVGRRPELQSQAPEFADAALSLGWPFDEMTFIQVAAQQGDAAQLAKLIERTPGPHPAREQWEQLLARATVDGEQIAAAAAAVDGQRAVAFEQIGEEIEKARGKGADIEQMANDLGVFANRAGAVSLAKAYADTADREERLAHLYTRISLGLGIATVAVIAVVAALTLKEHTSVTTAAQRAAFGTPLALLAAYVNRLATAYRNQAWKLRDVELQIGTTNPFLAGLEDHRRKEVLADLALRFFPGQRNGGEAPSNGAHDGKAMQLDPEQLLGLIMRLAQGERTAPVADVERTESA